MSTDRTLTPVELAQTILSGGRVVAARIHLIDRAAKAAELADVLDEVIAAAQQLQGYALRVADSDAEVEASAVFDEVMSHLDGGELS